MKRWWKIVLVLVIVLPAVGCDQLSKSIAKDQLAFSAPKTYFNGIVRLQYAENAGGFLSIGSNIPAAVRRVVVRLLSVIVILGFVLLFLNAAKIRTASIVALSMLLAGASGNLIDRLLADGKVTDFVLLSYGHLHTGIFNIADLLMTAGAFLQIVVSIRAGTSPDAETKIR